MVKYTMSRACSKILSSILPDPHLLTTLLLSIALTVSTGVMAAEVPLRAFSASYDLTKSGIKLGTVELSLEPVEQIWRWRLITLSWVELIAARY